MIRRALLLTLAVLPLGACLPSDQALIDECNKARPRIGDAGVKDCIEKNLAQKHKDEADIVRWAAK
jgi:hypothetical protein